MRPTATRSSGSKLRVRTRRRLGPDFADSRHTRRPRGPCRRRRHHGATAHRACSHVPSPGAMTAAVTGPSAALSRASSRWLRDTHRGQVSTRDPDGPQLVLVRERDVQASRASLAVLDADPRDRDLPPQLSLRSGMISRVGSHEQRRTSSGERWGVRSSGRSMPKHTPRRRGRLPAEDLCAGASRCLHGSCVACLGIDSGGDARVRSLARASTRAPR